jgi:hypothetical protein
MYRTSILICLVFLLASLGMAQSHAKPLNDAELDQITAAGFTVSVGGITAELTSDGVIHFDGSLNTPSGLVKAFGTLSVQGTSSSPGGIQIADNALKGAQSVLQINANNANLSVLTNLTIILNSTVSKLIQNNGK